MPVFRPKRRKNHTLWGGTYLYGLYKGTPPTPHPPPPRAIRYCVNISLVSVYFRQTTKVIRQTTKVIRLTTKVIRQTTKVIRQTAKVIRQTTKVIRRRSVENHATGAATHQSRVKFELPWQCEHYCRTTPPFHGDITVQK